MTGEAMALEAAKSAATTLVKCIFRDPKSVTFVASSLSQQKQT
jgi:hypothetical protein